MNESKKMKFIPKCKYMDVRILADYYEVKEKCILSKIMRYKIGLFNNGLILVKRKDIDIYFDLKKYIISKPYNSVINLKYNSDFAFTITNSGKIFVFSRKYLLE